MAHRRKHSKYYGVLRGQKRTGVIFLDSSYRDKSTALQRVRSLLKMNKTHPEVIDLSDIEIVRVAAPRRDRFTR